MKIFKRISKFTSFVAILSLLSQMFIGVMPAFALDGPTATVAHNETNKTITYTFSEPVVLRDALGNILPSSDYATSLAIYDRDTYLAHNLFDPEPAHVAGVAITDASLVSNVMTITYTGSLIKKADASYIVDAWGKNITDLVGNKMVQSASQIFTVTGDTTAPVITITGSASMLLNVGDKFTDPGATTNDGSVVTVTGVVDTAIAGVYELQYSSVDSVGNKAITVTRTVTVKAADVVPVVVATTAGLTTSNTGEVTTPTDTAVLGSQTTSDSTSAVKGSIDTKKTDTTPSTGFFASTSFGIYNWILLVIGALALAGAGWWAFAIRRRG